eukprot:gene28291-31399_t
MADSVELTEILRPEGSQEVSSPVVGQVAAVDIEEAAAIDADGGGTVDIEEAAAIGADEQWTPQSKFSRCASKRGTDLSAAYADVGWKKDEWQLPVVYHEGLMGQLPVVYHERYNITAWGLEKLHPFDACKFRKVVTALAASKKLLGYHPAQQLVSPLEASHAVLQDVHTEEYDYVNAFHNSSLKRAQVTELAPLVSLPLFALRRCVVTPMKYHVSGTMVATGLAVQHGWAINLGGTGRLRKGIAMYYRLDVCVRRYRTKKIMGDTRAKTKWTISTEQGAAMDRDSDSSPGGTKEVIDRGRTGQRTPPGPARKAPARPAAAARQRQQHTSARARARERAESGARDERARRAPNAATERPTPPRGGMHHASRGNGMGWCPFDDIMLAIRRVRTATSGAVQRVLYIDLDAHQGNGVARDKMYFKDDDLYILDAYNARVFPKDDELKEGINYKANVDSGDEEAREGINYKVKVDSGDDEAKEGINYKVEVDSGVKDDEYISKLQCALLEIKQKFPTPDLIFYNAVSMEAVLQRDEIVWDYALELGCPIVMTLSGGYTRASSQCIARSIERLFDKYELGKTAAPPPERTGWSLF